MLWEEVSDKMKIYGYARVSSRDQNADRQLIALRGFPVHEDNIFLDKLSGKDFNRPAYQRLLGVLEPDDVMVVKSIDRLGRNYNEILEQWRIITKKKLVRVVVLDMPMLDTRRGYGDLTGRFIADLVLEILSYVAETERDNIRQRQTEGIAAAKARGVRFGRPPIEQPQEFLAVHARWLQGEISAHEASRLLGVSRTTFLKWSGNGD